MVVFWHADMVITVVVCKDANLNVLYVSKNVNAMLSIMTKEYVEDEMIEESEENVADDDLSDIDGITDDALVVDNLLEHAKYLFSE